MTESNPEKQKLDSHTIRSQASALAEHLQRCGVQWMPKPRPEVAARLAESFAQPTIEPTIESTPEQPAADAAASAEESNKPAPIRPAGRVQSVAAFNSCEGPYPGTEVAVADRQAALDSIASEVSVCVRCEILSSCRTHTVFGEGSVSPRVAFFGEGPGSEEDRSGRPFVGKAGQLLTKMIEACTFRREDVYILNTVKCRPPGNRNPEPQENENCREYYERQFAILRPQYIVCLGAVSAQELLKSKLSVGRLRGKLHRYFESKVLVTYHPAYLLRNPAAKKAAWQDLQLMLHDAGIQP